jgi:hypothetical protein
LPPPAAAAGTDFAAWPLRCSACAAPPSAPEPASPRREQNVAMSGSGDEGFAVQRQRVALLVDAVHALK